MVEVWAAWVILGFVLVLAELVLSTFVVVWFGIGAIVVGLLDWVVPAMSMTTQIALWTAASIACTVLWFRVFKPHALKTRIGTSHDEFRGEIGLVARAIRPFEKGLVHFQKPILGDDKWEAIADDSIAEGSRVQVVSVEGNLLKVRAVA